MKWRIRPDSPNISLVDIESRIRGFIYDSQVNEADAISFYLGCSSISEEGMDHEEKESKKRVAKVSHLIPVIYALAHAMAEGTVAYQKDHADEEGQLPQEAWILTKKIFRQVSINTAVGVLYQLVDMEFVEVKKKKLGLVWNKK